MWVSVRVRLRVRVGLALGLGLGLVMDCRVVTENLRAERYVTYFAPARNVDRSTCS